MTRKFLITALLLPLWACAPLPPQEAPATADISKADYWSQARQNGPSGSSAANLLYYSDYVRNLGAADYAQEVERIRALYVTEKTSQRQLQYAVALSLPGGDLRRALELVEPMTKDPQETDAELTVFATWLYADLNERLRLETEVKRATQEARRTAAGAAKRVDELGKKVEAMKSIEKTLIERDTTEKEKQ